MSIVRRVEKQLDSRLRRLFAHGGEAAPEQGLELVEIQRAILDDVVARVQTLRRGKKVFPYNDVTVRIYSRDAQERELFSTAFPEEALTEEVRDALGRECPTDLRVHVELSDEAVEGNKPFAILCRKRAPEVTRAPLAQTATLVVTHGKAERDSYSIGAQRLNVGRLSEVLDDQERLLRRNDIVFSDEPVNVTVSRAHAYIEFDGRTKEFRLFDDHSAYGTTVFRAGKLLQVPAGAGRGVALKSGDEVHFGQARARFEQENS